MQQKNARKTYIEQEVFTATPQKLQLLLVEAAIKNINLTKKLWEEGRFEEALEPHSKAQNIIAEILCCLDLKGSPEIAQSLASIYVFIFRRLAESSFDRNQQFLDDAIKVLNAERQTWKEVCEKFGSIRDTTASESASFDSLDKVPKPLSSKVKPTPAKENASSAGNTGFSWDA